MIFASGNDFGIFILVLCIMLYFMGKGVAKVANSETGRAAGQEAARRFLNRWFK